MHRPLVPRNHAKSTETQGNAAKIVFVDLNDWQHRRKPLAPRANAITNVIDYAKFYSRSHRAVIRVYDEAGNAIEMHGACDLNHVNNPTFQRHRGQCHR